MTSLVTAPVMAIWRAVAGLIPDPTTHLLLMGLVLGLLTALPTLALVGRRKQLVLARVEAERTGEENTEHLADAALVSGVGALVSVVYGVFWLGMWLEMTTAPVPAPEYTTSLLAQGRWSVFLPMALWIVGAAGFRGWMNRENVIAWPVVGVWALSGLAATALLPWALVIVIWAHQLVVRACELPMERWEAAQRP